MNRIAAIKNELKLYRPGLRQRKGANGYAGATSRYALAKSPGLFGIAGLTVVEAVNLGLGGASLVSSAVPLNSGKLSLNSDKAQRLLTPQARQKLGVKEKTPYTFPVLYVGASKLIDAAHATIEVTWEGNAYGEIGAAYVRRNLDGTSDFSQSS